MNFLFPLLAFLLLASQAAAQWVQTSGPEGGNISAFISHNGFVFAGTSGAGVMRSADNGASWTPVNSGHGYPYPTSFLVKGSTLYSATVNVYRTTDNGGSWSEGIGLPTGSAVTSLATDGTYMFAGIASGFGPALVYRSSDEGVNWERFSTGSPDYAGVACLCISGNVLLAGVSGNGVYRSTDQGQTWSAASSGLPSFAYINSMAASGGSVLAGTSNSGVYRTTDNGTSWSVASSGLPAGTTVRSIVVEGNDVYASSSLYPAPAEIYKSSDNGSTWTRATQTLPPAEINTLAKLGGVFFVGTLGRGAVRSVDNGSTWLWANAGIINSRILALATHGSNTYAGTSDDGIYRSTDGGASWGRMTNGIPDNLKVRAIVTRGSTVFAIGSLRDSVFAYRTSDNGATWYRGAASIPGFPTTTFLSQRSALVVGNDLLVSIGTSIVWRSTNDGDSWTSSTGISFDEIKSLAEIGGVVYSGGNSMYRSTDGGSSWTAAGTGLPSYASFVGIAGIGSSAYAVRLYGPEVHRTTNDGGTWSAIAPLPGSAGNDLISIGSNLFAGINNGGVAMSANGGTSWTLIRTGLPLQGVVYHILSSDASYLYCGTDVRGVWKRPLSDVVSVGNEDGTIPEGFSLAQNYPNPFNPTTAIRMQIAVSSRVQLSVFDVLGRQVATLLDEQMAPGTHEVIFQATGLSSGTYVCRMTAGSTVLSRRMTVVK